jgi:hypothetical protein
MSPNKPDLEAAFEKAARIGPIDARVHTVFADCRVRCQRRPPGRQALTRPAPPSSRQSPPGFRGRAPIVPELSATECGRSLADGTHAHAANRAFLSIISCIRPCRIEDMPASTLLRSPGCHRRHDDSAIAGLGALLAGLRSPGCHRRHNDSAIASSYRMSGVAARHPLSIAEAATNQAARNRPVGG